LRKLGVALLVLVLAAGLFALRWEQLVMVLMRPRAPFDAGALPAPPDYRDLAFWTAHPGREDAADAVPEGVRAVDPARAVADAFYVHPTTYLGASWNGPVDDPKLNAQTDRLATLIQASAFNGCCAVYGPRYRQAHGHAFLRSGPEAAAAIEIAYGDVRDAFRYFLAHQSQGRPFVLAAHSQGSVLASRLLAEEIVGAGLSDRLVAAYLIGGPVTLSWPSLPPCADARATGCIVAWNARGPRFRGTPFDFTLEEQRLCVNPLTWRHDELPAAREHNEGAVFLHAGDGRPLPGFADARCRDGILLVSELGDAPRDFMSRVLDLAIGPENYHPIEYQIFYMNLRRNALERVEAHHQRPPSEDDRL
jgi:hypothetical protein